MPLPGLIAFDLDGTLLSPDGTLGDRAAAAVAELARRGVAIVPCTGRPMRRVRDLARAVDAPVSIVYQGASRYLAREDRCEHDHLLEPATARSVTQRLRGAFPDVMLGLEAGCGWFLDPSMDAERRPALEEAGLPLPDGVGEIEGFLGDDAIKILARHPSAGVEEMAAALEGLELYATWTGPHLLEVLHPRVNKRAALERQAAELGVPRERVAAFGDQANDVEMLAWAGTGVAMADGAPAARRAASELAPPCGEDGVAQVLERWLRLDDVARRRAAGARRAEGAR